MNPKDHFVWFQHQGGEQTIVLDVPQKVLHTDFLRFLSPNGGREVVEGSGCLGAILEKKQTKQFSVNKELEKAKRVNCALTS